MAKNPLLEIDWAGKGLRLESPHDKIQFGASLELLQFYDVKKFPTVVDIGSGPGHQAFALAELGVDVTCVDPKRPVYDHLPWVTADQLHTLPEQSAIWSHHCLEHIRDPIGALIGWRQALQPRGSLFLTVPQIDVTMSTDHINSYNIPLLVYHLAIAGYETCDARLNKRDSHIRVVGTKSSKYEPLDEPITDLAELAALGMFSRRVTQAIEETGRFTAEAIVLRWFDRTWLPARGGVSALTYAVNSLWR